VTDRDALAPVALGIEIAVALRDLHPGDWKTVKLLDLLANRDTFERLQRGETADSIIRSWLDKVEVFRARRARFLLY
jgi:uncharacterized protein YbbC (DUF1343 family)